MTATRSLALAVLLFAAPALAQETPPRDPIAAEALFERGKLLIDQGRTPEACAAFAESQRLDPAGGTLLRLALCHEAAGKLASAWLEFLEVVRVSKEGTGEPAKLQERVRLAREHLAAIEPRVPKLAIGVPVAARTDGLRVSANGLPRNESTWGVAIPVDPGDVLVVATRPGPPRVPRDGARGRGPAAERRRPSPAPARRRPAAASSAAPASPSARRSLRPVGVGRRPARRRSARRRHVLRRPRHRQVERLERGVPRHHLRRPERRHPRERREERRPHRRRHARRRRRSPSSPASSSTSSAPPPPSRCGDRRHARAPLLNPRPPRTSTAALLVDRPRLNRDPFLNRDRPALPTRPSSIATAPTSIATAPTHPTAPPQSPPPPSSSHRPHLNRHRLLLNRTRPPPHRDRPRPIATAPGSIASPFTSIATASTRPLRLNRDLSASIATPSASIATASAQSRPLRLDRDLRLIAPPPHRDPLRLNRVPSARSRPPSRFNRDRPRSIASPSASSRPSPS